MSIQNISPIAEEINQSDLRDTMGKGIKDNHYVDKID